jgi:hypothetical protein
MQTKIKYISSTILLLLVLSASGCVERELTINTEPNGATVFLNDEQIGQSPVTTDFNWYGDYKVRISKPGYDTLKTHRELKAPWYDCFPFDFFAQVLYPGKIVDTYEWTFELPDKTQIPEDELLKKAENLKAQVR